MQCMDLNVELFVISKHSNNNLKNLGTQDIMFLTCIKAFYSRFCPNQFLCKVIQHLKFI